MSRRKQAKPRAFKRDELEPTTEESAEDTILCSSSKSSKDSQDSLGRLALDVPACNNPLESMSSSPMVVMELENSPESGLNGGGSGTPTSWRSTDTPPDDSLSSPTSFGDSSVDGGGELTFTIGVTEGTPYPCHFCDKAFPRLSYLKRHEQVHSEHMPFKCDFCQRLFKHKRSRDRHVKLHTGDRKYRCTQCEAAFSRSDHLKIHLKTHDNAKPYQCAVCNRGYNTSAALTSHMQNHKKEQNTLQQHQQFRCLQCVAVFNTSKDLQRHISTHENDISSSEKSLPCAFCPEKFYSADDLRVHVEQRHGPETQGKCPECSETFLSLESLLQHKKLHEESKVEESKSITPRFSCGFCTKNEFPTMDSLQQHMAESHVPMNHNNKESHPLRVSSSSPHSNHSSTADHRISPSALSYCCEYCTMKFNSVNGLQRHTLSTHSFSDVVNNSQDSVLCTQCNKVFHNAAQLADHMHSMHDQETATSKDFLEKKSLNRNKVISSPRQIPLPDVPMFNGTIPPFTNSFARAFICSHCNAALPDFESFRSHLKSHLDLSVKKYTCFECDGQFPTEELLDAHVANHYLSTTTEYGCQSCLKMFVKPDHLQKHLMDIHAHQLYQCALCKEIFESKVNIQVHFAVKHSNECHMLKCTSCNAVFRTDLEFHVHVKIAHLAKMHPFRCYVCDLCFPTEIQLQVHFQSHKRPFSCIFCHEEFHIEFLLDRHIQEKHADKSFVNSDADDVQNLSIKSRPKGENEESFSLSHKKQLRCDICDACFTTESSMHAHRRQVHNIRMSGSNKPGQTVLSLFCAYCNESCKSRTDFENHMKTHTPTNTSKHKCNICDEVCPSAGTLAEHKLSHCKITTDNTCITCHTALKLEEHFHVHLHQHNPQGLPAPCVICRQTLMSDMEVQVHAKFHLKSTEPTYSCCVCGCQSSLQHLIVTGTQENHSYMCKECFHVKGDDLRCSECHVKFESVVEFEKHKSTHSKKTYQCIKCQMSFETETEIQAHVTTHVLQEGTNHACHKCPKIFDSPAKLQCHLIEHTYEGHSSYCCYMCSAVFTSSHLIQQHMLEHGLDARPYDCSLCHQKFFFRAELDNHSYCHRELAKEPNSYPCLDCNKTFSSPTNLQNHSKLHDQKPNSPSLKCSLCPEVFTNSADMQQHHFRAHGDAEMQENKCYPCSECDQVFPCLSNLQGHLRIHTQGTKYTCRECHKEFALSRNLTIHMRSHSGVKPYECPICKKRFARKENRKAHLKSHSGQKPFMCPHCGKTFSRKCHVKEHMRIHITSTTHPCEVCSETFPSVAQLKHHLSDAHEKQFDHSCSVCNELFESLESLDQHMLKDHDVQTNSYNSSPADDHSESSLGQSSSSGDLKDSESSECSSIAGESDTRDSPLLIMDDSVENQTTTATTT